MPVMIKVLLVTAAKGLLLPGITYSKMARTLYWPAQGMGIQRLGWLENHTLLPFSCSAIHTYAILDFPDMSKGDFPGVAITLTWLAEV